MIKKESIKQCKKEKYQENLDVQLVYKKSRQQENPEIKINYQKNNIPRKSRNTKGRSKRYQENPELLIQYGKTSYLGNPEMHKKCQTVRQQEKEKRCYKVENFLQRPSSIDRARSDVLLFGKSDLFFIFHDELFPFQPKNRDTKTQCKIEKIIFSLTEKQNFFCCYHQK